MDIGNKKNINNKKLEGNTSTIPALEGQVTEVHAYMNPTTSNHCHHFAAILFYNLLYL